MSDVLRDKGKALTRFETGVYARMGAFGKIRRWILRTCLVRGQRPEREVPVLTLRENRPVKAGQTTRKLAGASVGKFILTVTFLAGVISLLWFSLRLAEIRMYPVNACANVYAARLLATGHAFTGANLYQILLSWYLPDTSSSVDLFALARVLMLVIFWTNWILLAMATGEKLFSFRWLVALAGAASLVPLWNWGFEIRGSNLILTGLLLIWGVVRFRPAKVSACFFIGAVAVVLQCVSSNALVYTIPLSVGVLVFQPSQSNTARWKLALAWVAGVALALLALQVGFAAAGFKNGLTNTLLSANTFYDGRHSGFWHSTARLSAQTPLLWALVGSALVALTMELRRRGKSALSRDGILPETVLFVVAIAALFVPGNSFASSLLILVPIAFLLAYRYASALWKQIPRHSAAYPAIATLLVFLCIVPFVLATRKGLGWQNTRQDKLMNLAEEITDPGKDCIYDPVGMVPTRPIVDPRAFLHGQSVDKLINGPGPKVRDMLAANPPAVIIPSYRTDWLPKADHEFIRKRYVAVADDFLVLGKVLPKGGGSFEIYHPGRYRISPLKGSSLMGTYFEPKNLAELVSQKPVAPPPPLAGTLDGKPLTAQPVELTVGSHQLKCAGDEVPAVVWVGPRLNQLPRIGSGNHDLLFYNWY